MRLVWLIVAFAIFLVVVGFALLNVQLVTANFYVIAVRWPLSAFLLIFFVVGGLLGFLVGYCTRSIRKKSVVHH